MSVDSGNPKGSSTNPEEGSSHPEEGSSRVNYDDMPLNRSVFGTDFVFGAATSAYQVEGAWNEGGKGPSNWDVFSRTKSYKIKDRSNGCFAIDQYHMYKDDVKLMKRLGLDAYRFSISWSRILPGGNISAGVNREGITYYNNLIDELKAAGIEPYVTLFHWDVPQKLEEEYKGFLSEKIVDDFVDYAELCFWEFGDRVKYWITLNEPWTFTVFGYVTGDFPPGIGEASDKKGDPPEGNTGDEPLQVAHHLILAHANTYHAYNQKFKSRQGGMVGITNVSKWFEPLDPSSEDDKKAAIRAVEFMWGWFLSPITFGRYPESMTKALGEDRLPKFDDENLVKETYDFLGFNYYTTNYAKHKPKPPDHKKTSYFSAQEVEFSTRKKVMKDGKEREEPIGFEGGSDWMFSCPEGIYKLLTYTKKEFNNPLIYITENGFDEVNTYVCNRDALNDTKRIHYHKAHLRQIKRAMNEKVKVKSYFIWSLFDNYEWAEGYTVRFGIFYIDFINNLSRIPKASALWWTDFLANKPLN